jgi:hypothetical protein
MTLLSVWVAIWSDQKGFTSRTKLGASFAGWANINRGRTESALKGFQNSVKIASLAVSPLDILLDGAC